MGTTSVYGTIDDFAGMVVPLVATMPHRQGVAIALNYLSRVYFQDPSDDMPGNDA